MPDLLVASRAHGSNVADLVTPADKAARMKAQRAVLGQLREMLRELSPAIRRVLPEESGAGTDDLLAQADRVLG